MTIFFLNTKHTIAAATLLCIECTTKFDLIFLIILNNEIMAKKAELNLDGRKNKFLFEILIKFIFLLNRLLDLFLSKEEIRKIFTLLSKFVIIFCKFFSTPPLSNEG